MCLTLVLAANGELCVFGGENREWD